MFRINLLPARYGDSLWIEYGNPARPRWVLIDGGLASTYDALKARLARTLPSQRRFDLLAVTHVDADHIEGMVTLLADRNLAFSADDVWFNAWRHFSPAPRSLLGPVQGEFLSALIDRRRLNWNKSFADPGFYYSPAAIGAGDLPEVTLDGGMKITLLAPDRTALEKLKRSWKRAVQKAGIEAGNLPAWEARLSETPRLLPKSLLGAEGTRLEALARAESGQDHSVANGSSLAFLAEYDGKAVLFAGDAPPGILVASLGRLLQKRRLDRLTLDAFKVSHHGGSKNTTLELVEILDCQLYLFSTNGERFGHPDRGTVARILTARGAPCRLVFNYRSPANTAWDEPDLKAAYRYETCYPAGNEQGSSVEL